VHSPAFTKGADDIRAMGNDEIRASSEISNKPLQSPVRAMQKASETGKVASTLLDLRRTIEDLDPRQATGLKKLLGMIPFGDKLRDYFHKYEDAEFHLDAILRALLDGQDELRKDNVALAQEKVHLWETMQRLAQYSYVAEHLDAAVAGNLPQIEATDPDKAKTLRDEVLFSVRQKHQDLLTQLAVSIQGYLAIDLVRKNNLELIKGVDRATTTTIAALRTAVIVAQALAGEKLVLTQISALNTTTSNLIESTSQLLATQCVASRNRRPTPRSVWNPCNGPLTTSTNPWTRSTPSRWQRWTPCRRPSSACKRRSPNHRPTLAKSGPPTPVPRTDRARGPSIPSHRREYRNRAARRHRSGRRPARNRAMRSRPMGLLKSLLAAFGRTSSDTAAVPRSDDDEILTSLDRLQIVLAGKVPDLVAARIDRIANVVRETVPRLGNLGPGSLTAHDMLRTATSYLPEAIASYLRLPRSFADNRPVSNGKTSLSVLCDQLDLLASKMDDVFDAVCRADADALIAHGRFLADKFGSGTLAINPELR
jgi:hypothetical protein